MKPDTTIYEGERFVASATEEISTATEAMVTVDGEFLDPRPSLRLRNHSPDGFNWGYAGSGPAQLALAILLDFTGNPDLALHHCQDFKFAVIARLPGPAKWQITGTAVRLMLEKLEADRPLVTEGGGQ